MRLKKRAPDFLIFLTTILLLALGVVMVFSASAVTAEQKFGDAFYFLKNQLTWAVIGIVAMVVAMSVDYYRIKKLAWPALIIGVLCLIAVLAPGIGKEVKGAQRWIGIGSASFAPSEMIKLCLIFFMAFSLSEYGDKIKDLIKGLGPHLGILGLVVVLIMLQPDLGTTVAVAGTVYFMLLAAGARWGHLIGLAVIGVAGVLVLIITEEYRWQRFTAFLNPWKDPLDTGFQTIQSLYALGSGGLFGVGLGRSHQKMFYLPEQHSDFIFSILGEELGYLGVLVVIGLLFLFIWRGLRTAITCPDAFGSLLAVGITCWIGLQAIINIGVASGSLPVTGITFPLLSYGGSSLLFTLTGIGMLLNISKFSTQGR
ncbi:MAG: putative lipid II flippase FtsW [Bacillota bacterium]